jgi:O-antigen/teichoic acid export membrane protein
MKKLTKNLLALFISDAGSRLFGFVAMVYLARLLAIEGLGQVRYGFAFLSYALLLANPGLTTIGAREVAKNKTPRNTLEEIMGLKIALSCIIFVLFVIGLYLIPGHDLTKKIIFFYLLSLFPFGVLLEFVFQGKEEMEYIGISRLLQYGVYVLFLLLLLKSAEHIIMVPVAFLIGYTAAALFLIVFFARRYWWMRPRFSIPHWRTLLTMSIPVGLATIFNQVSINLPPIILGVVHSKIEVGAFSASFTIIVMLLVIERVFYYVFFPILSRHYARDPQKLRNSFSLLVRLLFTMTIPLTLGGIIVAPQLIYLIYGTGYEPAIVIVRVLLFYFLIAPITTIFGYGLVAINQERRFFKVITITAVINVILIVILGIYFKGVGAAAAFVVSEIVAIMLMHRELTRFVSFVFLPFLVRPFIAAAGMVLSLYLLRGWHIIFLIIIGAVVYGILLFVVKGFSMKDIRNLRKAL